MSFILHFGAVTRHTGALRRGSHGFLGVEIIGVRLDGRRGAPRPYKPCGVLSLYGTKISASILHTVPQCVTYFGWVTRANPCDRCGNTDRGRRHSTTLYVSPMV